MSTDYMAVNIPKRLYDEIAKRVTESQGEFKDVEEYVEFVLTELFKEEEEEETGEAYTAEEQKDREERLRRLGYI